MENTLVSYPYMTYDGKNLSVDVVKLNFDDRQSCINAINEIEANVPENGFIDWVTVKAGPIPTEPIGSSEFIDQFLEILNDPSRPMNRHESDMGYRVYGNKYPQS